LKKDYLIFKAKGREERQPVKSYLALGVIFLSLFLFSISFVSSLNVDIPEPPINYSLIPTVNNSEFFDGYSVDSLWTYFSGLGSDLWLAIDGSNANQDIDIGTYDFTTSGALEASSLTDGITTLTMGDDPWSYNGAFQSLVFLSDSYYDSTGTYVLDTSTDPWTLNTGLTLGGHLLPDTSLTYDLGSGANRWRWLYAQNISSDYLDVTYDANIDGDLQVDGTINATSMNVTNLTIKNMWIVNTIASGNITAENITANGYFFGDGSQLTGIVHNDLFGLQGGGGEGTEYYHLSQIVHDSSTSFLDTSSFIDNTLTIGDGINLEFLNGNLTADTYFGDGSQLTGISTYNATYDAGLLWEKGAVGYPENEVRPKSGITSVGFGDLRFAYSKISFSDTTNRQYIDLSDDGISVSFNNLDGDFTFNDVTTGTNQVDFSARDLKTTGNSFLGLRTEKVTNGAFTGSSTGWTEEGNWAYNDNNERLIQNGAGSDVAVYQDVGIVAGRTYQITYRIVSWAPSGTGGKEMTVTLGGVRVNTHDSQETAGEEGTYTETITATSTGNLVFSVELAGPSPYLLVTIDDVSVKERGVSIIDGSVEMDKLAIGSNVLSGLSSGDINASTIYYDTLTAKSPIFMCSDDWCSISFPKRQKTLWIQKDDDWNILDIVYDNIHYTPKEFNQNVCSINETTEEICGQLNSKVQKLQDKAISDRILETERATCLYNNYSWDGECFEVVKVDTNYNGAVEIIRVPEVETIITDCIRLDFMLKTETYECSKEIETGEMINKYQFKEGCGWNEDYYCYVRVAR